MILDGRSQRLQCRQSNIDYANFIGCILVLTSSRTASSRLIALVSASINPQIDLYTGSKEGA